MNPRQRMRWSNRKAVNYLLEHGYDEIWLKAHGRRQDLTYCQGVWYRALDLWNLFETPILKWLKKVKGVNVLVINVKYKERTHEVLLREYKCTDMEVSDD